LKGPGSFFLDSGHGSDLFRWQDEPKRQRVFVAGDRIRWYWVTHRTYEEAPLSPDEELSPKLQGDLFFTATGWWPPDYRRPPPRPPGGNRIALADVARAEGYGVRPFQEEWDGRWCHVLEKPGADALWIDVEGGFRLLKRAFYDSGTGATKQEYLLRDHREAAPGVWFPTTIEYVMYDHEAKDPADWGRALLHVRALIEEIRANDVADSIFDFQPPPGALLIDRKTGACQQTQPGGLDFLDSNVLQIRPVNDNRTRPATWFYGWFAGLPVLLMVGGWELWLRRRKSQSSGSAVQDKPAESVGAVFSPLQNG
jgi:hypothetical protein